MKGEVQYQTVLSRRCGASGSEKGSSLREHDTCGFVVRLFAAHQRQATCKSRLNRLE